MLHLHMQSSLNPGTLSTWEPVRCNCRHRCLAFYTGRREGTGWPLESWSGMGPGLGEERIRRRNCRAPDKTQIREPLEVMVTNQEALPCCVELDRVVWEQTWSMLTFRAFPGPHQQCPFSTAWYTQLLSDTPHFVAIDNTRLIHSLCFRILGKQWGW